MKSRSRKLFYAVIAIAGLALSSAAIAQQAQSQEMTTTTNDQETAKLAPQELDSLVAPIALYSDPLLAQTLAASTYPLEVIQLQQWMAKNTNLKDKALADAVAKQPWDPSVQGLVMYPDVVTRMSDNIQWTSDLGNAFLAQQSDVMDAVQRMRAKAQGTGNLKTSAQQVVETETVPSGKQVIKIEQASPDVVYVPSYDPTVVYGPPPPAYPYYPYTYPGYVPGTALMWGTGIALGAAAWGAWGGHWGNCDWNGGNVKINNNYNYNKNNNFNRNVNRQGQGNWQHNPQHRGNAPYGDRNTANKFGGRGPGGAGGVGGAGRPGGAGGIGGAGRPGGAAVRVALVVPEDPVVRVALVVLEDPVVRVALVVPEDPVVRVALVVPEDPVARVALVVPENPVVPAALELETVPVAVLARELDQVAVVLVRDHLRARLAVPLRTKSVTAAHRPDLVPLLTAGEDLAAAVAETTREPVAAEAVIVWAAAE